ncbi:hypothetical protein BYT27DRAFT_7068806, partial [Phlegmacium glaucopus]
MSETERVEATEDTMADLKEHREAKAVAPHHVPLNAFHDTRANIDSIVKEMSALYSRTGTEMLLVAVRSSSDRYNQPFFFKTSEKVEDFFSLTFKHSLADLVGKFECFCLSGVEGVLAKRENTFIKLKKKTSALITSKLERITGSKTRVMYTNFDDNMTAKHGIIIKGWPLCLFCSPGDVRTFTELKILHDAWQSGTAHFYKLTTAEATEWSNRRFEKSLEQT